MKCCEVILSHILSRCESHSVTAELRRVVRRTRRDTERRAGQRCVVERQHVGRLDTRFILFLIQWIQTDAAVMRAKVPILIWSHASYGALNTNVDVALQAKLKK